VIPSQISGILGSDFDYPNDAMCDTDAQFWPPKGGEGEEMSIIHIVTSVLARDLLKRLDEQPPKTDEYQY